MMAAPAVAAALAVLIALLAPSLQGYESSAHQMAGSSAAGAATSKRHSPAPPYPLSGERSSHVHAETESKIEWSSSSDQAADDEDDDTSTKFTTGHTVLEQPPLQKLVNCSVCKYHENVRIQSIKREILDKLGMEQAPNTTLPISIKRSLEKSILFDYLTMQQDTGTSNYDEQAKTLMGVIIGKPISANANYLKQVREPAESTSKSGRPWHPPSIGPAHLDGRYAEWARPNTNLIRKLRHSGIPEVYIYHFQPSKVFMRKMVENASLFVYLPKVDGKIRLVIFKVVGNESEHQSLSIQKDAGTMLEPHPNDKWVVLNVRRLVQEWFDKPESNLGIVIKVEDERGKEYTRTYASIPDQNTGQPLDPFIEFSIADNYSRSKRETVGFDCDESSSQKKCCRYPLVVDFSEFGWDFIIAPKRFNTFYCSGECVPFFLEENLHTQVMHRADTGGKYVPCCAARKLSSMTLIYYDGNIVYVSTLPNMRVEYCGCF
ncbi:Hypothetical predicted protein [Cloeon dipterum]|uniref:TGF-beta family profile domain-containing protein n=1 Tax=Cloeon dipterum TaxID=197152 RepID=A0A8S1DSC7_9INSE|nr:Hypothetical predicted protein [Cloeon dipterum]